MSNYSKEAAKKLHIHTFATTTSRGATIVRAYLKENAARKLGVSIDEVYPYNAPTGGSSVDELVSTYDHSGNESFKIEMKNE
jgi:hypothetical protein